MKAALPLMKSVLTTLASTFSISLELLGGMSAADVAIQKKTYQSGTTVWIISNEETEDIMEIAKSLEKSGLIKKELVKYLKMKHKNKKEDFFQMLLGTLAASILGNALAGKGVIKAGEGVTRTDQKV